MKALRQNLEPSWLAQLSDQFEQPYWYQLEQFLSAELQAQKIIYPAENDVFNALNATSYETVKVVILGQDPYHSEGQAHGLSFSVPRGQRIPPSLKNIFNELHRDLQLPIPAHGCLQSWAQQGVLLLNAVLTVEQQQAGSHAGKGWELFTDAIVARLSDSRSGLVFMLWGAYAQKKGRLINQDKHCVLSSAHPSPLSAHRGFLGNQHFSKANHYLTANHETGIRWSLD
ncbi:MAG: uracil-DNA glycosylase [Pseudomonadota bacterium]|nr:uracil-DNA glycosylase [Pseudomonadota bacterium]